MTVQQGWSFATTTVCDNSSFFTEVPLPSLIVAHDPLNLTLEGKALSLYFSISRNNSRIVDSPC